MAFEVVGAESTLDTCIHAVKPGGRVVMIGNSMTETIPVNINRAVLQEVQLLGSVSRRLRNPELLAKLTEGAPTEAAILQTLRESAE